VTSPASVHAARRDRLRDLIGSESGVDALVVTHLPNVRYLTGFSGSNGVLVVARDAGDDRIGTDGRYVDQLAGEAPGLRAVIDRATLAATLDAGPHGRLGVEASLTLGEAEELRSRGLEPVLLTGLVERLRSVKDAGELALLVEACRVTAEAMDALAGEIRVGATEVRLARRLEQLFGELGAEDRAFDTIVAGGPHSAIPHHQPGSRPLETGDLLVIDAGARMGGYHADMTRTFVVGRPPAPWQAEIHAAVEEAQARATEAYLPAARVRDIDAIARAVVAAHGYGEAFTHGLGHGVGLEIHEAPIVGTSSTGTIVPDMAITVEPGVYLPGRGGVRIEDTLVVADAGPRVLTQASRGLREVG
jgi:Xaa-Pro aminopeptidase